jgi:hypothetical protein
MGGRDYLRFVPFGTGLVGCAFPPALLPIAQDRRGCVQTKRTGVSTRLFVFVALALS